MTTGLYCRESLVTQYNAADPSTSSFHYVCTPVLKCYSTQWNYVSRSSQLCDVDSLADDVIKWKDFPRYWPFVRGIHRSPVDSHHKGQWRGALMFSLIVAWANGWANNRDAGDLRRYLAHHDVSVMHWNQETVTLTTPQINVKETHLSNILILYFHY